MGTRYTGDLFTVVCPLFEFVRGDEFTVGRQLVRVVSDLPERRRLLTLQTIDDVLGDVVRRRRRLRDLALRVVGDAFCRRRAVSTYDSDRSIPT